MLHAAAPWVGTSKDWYKLSAEEIAWYRERGCVDTLSTCPKGGVVLWDSRAIHANTKPVRGREYPCLYDAAQPLVEQERQEAQGCIRE